MASKKISIDLLADRYASALYDLANEQNCVDKVIKDLENIKIYYNENKKFALMINTPLISPNEKLGIINKILTINKAEKLTINFFKVLSKNKRFFYLIKIINKLNKINLEKRGSITAEVTTSDSITALEKNLIQKTLKDSLGNKLSIVYNIDKLIIGGLIVKIGSKLVDASLLNKIDRLKLIMKEAK